MTPRRWRALTAGTVAVVAAFAPVRSTTSNAGPSATKVTLKAQPTTVTTGSDVTFRVRTKNAVKGQKATLQRRSGGTWVKVTAKKLPATTKLNLKVAPPPGTTTYRVKLARKGDTAGATSKAVAVTAVEPAQTGTFQLPSSAVAGTTVTATAGFSPPRPGRGVHLQRLDSGTWTTIDTDTQDAGGGASFAITADVAGSFQYRAVALAHGGITEHATDVRTLVVTEPEPWTDETTLVSHDVNGGPGNGYTGNPSISDDGRFVAYDSTSSDLVADDPDNDQKDVFLWDRSTDTTVWVSRSSTGGSLDRPAESPVISGNGRYVFFNSPATNINGNVNPFNVNGVFRWDRLTGETVQLKGDFGSGAADGMVIEDAGSSGESAIVRSSRQDLTDDDYSGVPVNNHLFKWTAPVGNTTGSFLLVDKTPEGKPGNHLVFDGVMSDDGMSIAFTSWASDLDSDVPVSADDRHAYLWRASATPRITAVSVDDDTAAGGNAYVTGISGDGAVVGFLYGNDDVGISTGGVQQAIAWRRSDVNTPYRLASHNVGLTTPGSAISVDFVLAAAGLTGTFRSFAPLDSADTNGFYDIYAWNDGVVSRIAQAHDGTQPNQNHGRSDLAADGGTVVFESYATNLTPVTTAGLQIFVAGVP
ncbi:hypothetical protein [Nocardioides dilutus]